MTAVKVGDRVAALSFKSYAEYDIADEEAVVRLPDTLKEMPSPGEPLGCAMNIFRRSDIKSGQTVAIVGIGFLGVILTKLASDTGARVIAISRRPFSLDLARRFGAAETIPLNDHQNIIDQVIDLTNGNLCDRVIEAVGKQWPLDLASELVRERGKLIVAGNRTNGGAALKNVNGSFYDFVADRYHGTQREQLTSPPDDWGGRAAAGWAMRLSNNRNFDREAESLYQVAEVIDRIYHR